MEDTVDAGRVMRPFPAFCLGWFCLGYHLSDSVGRVSAIQQLLVSSGIMHPSVCTADNVRNVLHRLLEHHPRWLTLDKSPLASLTV
jgi:hypothetical protein